MQLSVKEIVNSEMTALGYKRLGLHWYKPYSEVIHVVELRKSQWGDYYTLNLAIWVNKLGLNKHPKSRECNLQVAINRVDGCPDDIDAALNQEDYWKMDAEHRREIIKL